MVNFKGRLCYTALSVDELIILLCGAICDELSVNRGVTIGSSRGRGERMLPRPLEFGCALPALECRAP